MLLWRELLNELGNWCCTSTSQDLKTVLARVEHEGLSFLTITLPSFCDDFQKSLSEGKVSHNQFKSFAFSGGLPQLFGGFLDLVFDRGTGRILDTPSIDAVHAIRQLTLVFGKVAIPCSDARVAKALNGYVECEKSVKHFDSLRTPLMYEEFKRVSRLLWSDIFTEIDSNVYYLENILPKHGPGATADKLVGNSKYNQMEWTDRLEDVFPAARFLISNWNHLPDLDGLNWLEPGAERPVRVITVPKTLKTPRIIAIEPTCMQYAQQALMEQFVEKIEGDNLLSSFVGFSDQGPNQDLAQKGSLNGKLATLDLSEASDRVSNQLVRSMFANHPHLLGAVDASRSRKADVPGRGVKRLAKFASMGSALCFPVEAMVFLTLLFLGIQDELKRPLTRKDIESFRGQVRVYGDDIIIPVEYVRSAVRRLETFGFKVNANKSFWTGSFRESCGKDYYAGHDVSVVRVRQLLPSQRNNVKEIISTVSLRNQLYLAGRWRTVKWLDKLIEELIPFPAVAATSPVQGKLSFLGYQTERMSSTLHAPLVKGCVVSGLAPKSPLDGYGALLKFFLKRGIEPFADKNHLERYGRPDSVNIKIRWASPF